MDVINLIKEWGSGGMMVVVTLIFLQYLRETQRRWEDIVVSHLDNVSRLQSESSKTLADALANICRMMDRMEKVLRDLSGGSHDKGLIDKSK